MKILVLAARLPYPLNTGAKIRSFHIIQALAQEHKITLLAYIGSSEENGYVTRLQELGIRVIPVLHPGIDEGLSPTTLLKALTSILPLTVAKYASRSFEAELKILLSESFDLIHCEHLHLAQYISRPSHIPLTFDAHNVETEIAWRLFKSEKNIFRKFALKWNHGRLREYERQSLAKFDLTLAVSERDRQQIMEISKSDRVVVIENGVDTDYFNIPHGNVKGKKLVFVGSMDWWPNEQGILSFVSTTWKHILAQDEEVTLYVVGRNPSKKIRDLSGRCRGVVVTGEVTDVRPYIYDAAVYVVPLNIGGGTRLKVLEAFSMSKAVVSTSLGSEGIEYTNEHDIFIADKPKEFADKVLHLFCDPALCQQVGENARNLALQKYSWKAVGEKLKAHYRSLGLQERR